MNDERFRPAQQEPEETPLSPPDRGEVRPESFWHLVAQASTLGWNLMVPIVGGVLLGRYLDDTLGKEFTWTLSLLFMGVAVAFNNLYAMYNEQTDTKSVRERIKKRQQGEDNLDGSEQKGSKEVGSRE